MALLLQQHTLASDHVRTRGEPAPGEQVLPPHETGRLVDHEKSVIIVAKPSSSPTEIRSPVTAGDETPLAPGVFAARTANPMRHALPDAHDTQHDP